MLYFGTKIIKRGMFIHIPTIETREPIIGFPIAVVNLVSILIVAKKREAINKIISGTNDWWNSCPYKIIIIFLPNNETKRVKIKRKKITNLFVKRVNLSDLLWSVWYS